MSYIVGGYNEEDQNCDLKDLSSGLRNFFEEQGGDK